MKKKASFLLKSTSSGSKKNLAAAVINQVHSQFEGSNQGMSFSNCLPLLSNGGLSLEDVAKPTYLFEDEYDGINIVEKQIPSQKTKKLIEELNKYQDFRSAKFVAQFNKSKGNYLVDQDDNVILDAFGQFSSIPVGYNHPYLVDKFKNDERFSVSFLNRPSLGVNPPSFYLDIIRDSFLRVLPKGCDELITLSTGAEATENAFKLAFINYQKNKRNGKPISEKELESALLNQEPGCPKLCILSFKSAFHGRSFGALSSTRSKSIHKLDFPQFQWPCVDFPNIKYPFNEYEKENYEEMDRCLEQVEKVITESHIKNSLTNKTYGEVAGLIVEPIQAEGGDRHAHPYFFRELRRITKENGIALICDEVQTGAGATGTFWAHEQWGLREEGPDIVCFSKKMQAAGLFYRKEFRPDVPYRIFNTWLGDPTRALQLSAILDVIERQKLLELVKETGTYLVDLLEELADIYPGEITNIRGKGTFIAFDVKNQSEMITNLLQRGVEVGACGKHSIRIRPMLIFHKYHANIFMQVLNDVLKQK
ncbi:hypothetical protein ABK040_007549 [Willaertia magna]